MLGPQKIKPIQASECLETLRRLSDLTAELPRAGIDPFHVRGGQPLGGRQRRAEGDLQGELLLDALGGIWQRLKQRQPLREVTDRFHMR